MSKLLQLLGGASSQPSQSNSTVTAIADLMERNRRFEIYMRRKVADLEEKVALDEASEVDVSFIADEGGFEAVETELDIETEPVSTIQDAFPEIETVDLPPNNAWDDDWELDETEPEKPDLPQPMQPQPQSPEEPVVRLAPATDDWQQIPGLLETASPADDDEIADAEWDTALPEGELNDFD